MAAACAEGVATPAGLAQEALPSMAAPDASVGDPGGGDPLAMPDAGAGQDVAPEPAFSGEACTMGDMLDCTCADGGAGLKVCKADMASPTGGAFGPCEQCQPPPPPEPMTAPDAGTTGGTAGVGSTPPPGGDPDMNNGGMRTCDVNACPTPPAPLPLLPPPMACCTAAGACGQLDLFGGCI